MLQVPNPCRDECSTDWYLVKNFGHQKKASEFEESGGTNIFLDSSSDLFCLSNNDGELGKKYSP